MHLEMLREEIAQGMVLLLDEEVRSVGHGCNVRRQAVDSFG